MALEVGASTANMRNFYGHLLVKDAQFNDRLWPDPSPDTLISHGILVDGHGRRILDENRGGDGPGAFSDRLCWAVAQSQTPQRCWVVFDERIWETAGRQDGPASINPLLLDEGGTLLRAHSVGDLARLAGLGEDALDATVRDFNRYATNGEPIEPPRSGTPLPLASPLMAIPILIGITFAMGGILVDGHGRALDVQGQPIPGLYSAGGAMAGLQGGTENGYSGGWSEAATFGLLAGEHAALFTAPAREI
jgi:fumarate reductase flavoprotein subunit